MMRLPWVTTTPQGYGQPSVSAIQRAVSTLDLYSNRKQLVRFLVLLENFGQNEQISFQDGLAKCEIEHIMPQTLDASWSHISAAEHQRYLHTLGNLSITYDNGTLRNLPFAVKKQRLAETSRIRLNQMLLSYDEFGPEQIRDRAWKLLRRFFDAYGISYDDVPIAESDTVPERIGPQAWLETVRSRSDAAELRSLVRAATWKAICDHLGIPVRGDSAHRRLEARIQEEKPFWPSTW